MARESMALRDSCRLLVKNDILRVAGCTFDVEAAFSESRHFPFGFRLTLALPTRCAIRCTRRHADARHSASLRFSFIRRNVQFPLALSEDARAADKYHIAERFTRATPDVPKIFSLSRTARGLRKVYGVGAIFPNNLAEERIHSPLERQVAVTGCCLRTFASHSRIERGALDVVDFTLDRGGSSRAACAEEISVDGESRPWKDGISTC